MGWSEIYIDDYKSKYGKLDRKKILDETLFIGSKKHKLLKSSMVGTTYYAAVEYTDENEKYVYALVCLTSLNKGKFLYKDMNETCGPYEIKCPKSILKMLTPTDDEYALDWRKRCQEYHSPENNWLNKLPLGSKIEWVRHDGKTFILQKCPPAYQFKSWWWKIIGDEKGYISKKYVTINNSKPI